MPKKFIPRKTNRFHLKLHTKFVNIFELRKNLNSKSISSEFINYGLIVNISELGVCILTNTLLNLDNFLELSFTLPARNKNIPMKIKGIVRWSRKKNHGEYNGERYNEYNFCSGIEFLKDQLNDEMIKFFKYWKSLGMDKNEK